MAILIKDSNVVMNPLTPHDEIPYDVLGVISDRCGDDIARYLEEYVKAIDAERIYAAERVNSDVDSLMESCSEYTSLLSEIMDYAKEMKGILIGAKRLDREKLLKLIRYMEKAFENA